MTHRIFTHSATDAITSVYKNRFSDLQFRVAMWKILTTHFFQKYVSPQDTVVDVGCGYCEFINAVRCKTKIGIDMSPESVKHAAKDVRIIRTISTRMTGIADSSVDVVFVSNFFEHITRSDIVETLDEIHRILRPQGKVMVLQPNIRFLAKDYWMFFDHITAIDDRALVEVFLAKDFLLRKRILKFLPFTTVNAPKIPWLVILYLKMPFVWRFFGRLTFLLFVKK